MSTDVQEEWDIHDTQARAEETWEEGFEGGEDQAIELEDAEEEEAEEEFEELLIGSNSTIKHRANSSM